MKTIPLALAAIVTLVPAASFGQSNAEIARDLLDLKSKVGALQGQVAALQAWKSSQETINARNDASMAMLKSGVAGLTTSVGTITTNVDILKSGVDEVTSRTKYITTVGYDTYFTGTNVHILQGPKDLGYANGLGNLIVGFNASRPEGDDRGGSHNIVFGDMADYRGEHGLVGGYRNAIWGNDDVVLAGERNVANGFDSLILTGTDNFTIGLYDVALTGSQNYVGNNYGLVGTGNGNIVGDGNSYHHCDYGFVLGGKNNRVKNAECGGVLSGYNGMITADGQLIGTGSGITPSPTAWIFKSN